MEHSKKAKTVTTFYLPAERESKKELDLQHNVILVSQIKSIVENFPMIAMIINDKRQIVWMNKAGNVFFNASDLYGDRPGEAFSCVHAGEGPGGCGTSTFCVFCNAPKVILKAFDNDIGNEECIIERVLENPNGTGNIKKTALLNLNIWTTPVIINDSKFVLFVASDISQKNRHEALERIFYHDISNTVSGMKSILELLIDGDEELPENCIELLHSATEQLLEEIDSQRSLKAAVEGRLTVAKTKISIKKTIEQAIDLFQYPLFGRNIKLVVAKNSEPDFILECDQVILRRVIVNMIKNAVEASRSGNTIEIDFKHTEDFAEICVNNETVMTEETQLRVFQPSFSTKGKGRGLGTYGMKMLIEQYLCGSINFVSNNETGTTFTIKIPF